MAAVTETIDVGAWIRERERVRWMRAQRHLVVATAGAVTLAMVGVHAGSLLSLILIALLVGGVLNSLVRSVDAYIGYLWGWVYGEPTESTPMDRYVDTVIARLKSITPGGPPDEEVKVWVVGPRDGERDRGGPH